MKKLFLALAVAAIVGCGGKGTTGTPAVAAAAPETADIPVDMVFVEGGTFLMGCPGEMGEECLPDEKPARKVTVGDFYIGKTEVTQGLWKAVMGKFPSNGIDEYVSFEDGIGDDYPVYYVSWGDVQEFIEKLNAKTGKIYRLPTDAEWEYAARGGNNSMGYGFSGSDNPDEVAWHLGNSGRRKHPVGTKRPNELGIYDMSGNVDELTSHAAIMDLSGPCRVTRGGNWQSTINFNGVGDGFNNKYRVYNTGYLPEEGLSGGTGFRLALSPEAAEPDRGGGRKTRGTATSPKARAVTKEPFAGRPIERVQYEYFGRPSYYFKVTVTETETGAIAGYSLAKDEIAPLEIKLSTEEWRNFVDKLYEYRVDTWEKRYGARSSDGPGWSLKLTLSDNDSLEYSGGNARPSGWYKLAMLMDDMEERIKNGTVGEVEKALSAEYNNKFEWPINDLKRATSRVEFSMKGYGGGNDFRVVLNRNRTKPGAFAEFYRRCTGSDSADRYGAKLNIEEWADFINALYKPNLVTWKKYYGDSAAKGAQWELRVNTSESDFNAKIISKGGYGYPPYWDELKELMDGMMARIEKGMGGCKPRPASPPDASSNPDSIAMVFVDSGTFTMRNGCDKVAGKARKVTVGGFYIGKYEVTQGLWVSVMGNNTSKFRWDKNLPVEQVNYKAAQHFIRRLNNMTGKRYRLLTEAEWKYAADGGNKSGGYSHSGGNDIDKAARYDDKTYPVGTKQANELGIHDMSGNVKEWVGGDHAERGNNAFLDGAGCGSARAGYDRADLGFRLALDTEESSKRPVPNIDWYAKNPNADTFTVSTADELAGLAAIVNGKAGKVKGFDFRGRTVRLANDIDISAYGAGHTYYDGLDYEIEGWVPIGHGYRPRNDDDLQYSFKGVFDGGGKTIRGLYIKSKSHFSYVGLFGNIHGGEVKNLGVAGVNIDVGGGFAGGLAGVVGRDSPRVSNCYTTGAVKGNGSDVGGLVGMFDHGAMLNSYSACDVTGKDYHIGGLVGMARYGSLLKNCYSTGAVSSDGRRISQGVGGIVGDAIAGARVVDCYSTGAVTGSGSDVGGVVGNVGSLFEGVVVANCYSTGAVSGNEYVGGIAGKLENGVIYNCAALNPSVKAEGPTVGRVAGGAKQTEKSAVGVLKNIVGLAGYDEEAFARLVEESRDLRTLYGNAALEGMSGGKWSGNGAESFDGADVTAAQIRADGTIGGRFTAQNGWATGNGKLPGFGAAAGMPGHLK